EWVYAPPGGNRIAGSIAKARLLRLLYNHIVLTPKNELNDLSGNGIIRSGDSDIPGEYIKWNNNTLYAAGNEDVGNVMHITGYKDTGNGRVYYTDNVLQFSEKPVAIRIKELASNPGSEFSNFFKYLEKSSLYNDGVMKGIDLGTNYTFMIPNNAAIQAAVNAGVLPGTGTGAI